MNKIKKEQGLESADVKQSDLSFGYASEDLRNEDLRNDRNDREVANLLEIIRLAYGGETI